MPVPNKAALKALSLFFKLVKLRNQNFYPSFFIPFKINVTLVMDNDKMSQSCELISQV